MAKNYVSMFLVFVFIFDQGRFLATGSNLHACCDIGCPLGLFLLESVFGPYGDPLDLVGGPRPLFGTKNVGARRRLRLACKTKAPLGPILAQKGG